MHVDDPMILKEADLQHLFLHYIMNIKCFLKTTVSGIYVTGIT